MRRPARARVLAGLLALLCSHPLAAALRLQPVNEGLSAAETAAAEALVAATLAQLPAALRDRLDREVRIDWRQDLPAHVHGRARNGRIFLQRTLLQGWMAGGSDAGGDAPGRHAALAALIHELAHVYDRDGGGRLSADPRLLDLAGWPVRALRLGLRGGRNDLRDRSPDPYELASPAEFVAVNLEHFLLDPGYACRRPALHRHFAAHFALEATPGDCGEELPFVAASGEQGVLQWQALAPTRVFAVDYLLAEANEQPMSRWGHSMLRLVVCAPGRAPGPDCRYDLEHHLVLSFRAFVDDVQISSWRGLTGAYPSRLFVLPLQQVVDEYTRVELRGLQSLPLRLDADEIASLLERAAGLHWSYDGRYRFVTANCAVDTWHLLNDGVPRLASQPLRSITPTGLLRRLLRAGLVDAGVLDDPARARREGYRFDSMAEHFEAMFAVADAELDLPATDVQAWFAQSPEARRASIARGGVRATAALLVLEQAALRREELRARESLKRGLLRGAPEAAGEAAELLRALFADGAYAGRPSALLQGAGYGLPLEGERERLQAAVADEDVRLAGLREALYRQARAWLAPAQAARLEGARDNLAQLGERLRSLEPQASR